MRKIILSIITFFVFINLTNAEVSKNNTIAQTGTGMPEHTILPTSHLEEKSKIKYTYFYGATCPHCMEVDSFFKKTKVYENFDIVKKEVWSDRRNAVEMTKKVEELGLKEVGVPFIVINDGKKEIGLSGSDEIPKYFLKNFPEIKKYMEIEKETKNTKIDKETKKDYKKSIVIVILILLAVLVPIILIKLSNKK